MENELSRTEKTKRNTLVSGLVQVFLIGTRFLIQMVFIHQLGKAYTGINGLFNNVILVLNLAELGIGSVLTHSLYRALHERHSSKISGLMNFYRKVYHGIGFVISAIGLAILPLLPYLMKGNTVPHPTFIYLLFLFNTVMSYFFSFKRVLLTADQKEYLNQLNLLFFSAIQIACQLVVLLVFQAYIFYLLLFIFFQLLSNVVISRKINQLYPFLKENKQVKISKEELATIQKNTKELIGGKLSEVAIIGTDNILLSAMVRVSVVGVYSNYELIVNAITKLFNQVIGGATSSIGHLVHDTMDKKRVEEVLYRHAGISYLVALLVFTCLVNLFNDCVLFLAQGDRSYLVSLGTTWLIALNLALQIMRNTPAAFFNALGTYQYMGIKSVIEVLLNLVFSVILLSQTKLGIGAVVLGTLLANVLVNSWWEPYQLYRLYFRVGYAKYLLTYYARCLLLLATGGVSGWVLQGLRTDNAFGNVLISGMISVGLSLVVIGFSAFREVQWIWGNFVQKKKA